MEEREKKMWRQGAAIDIHHYISHVDSIESDAIRKMRRRRKKKKQAVRLGGGSAQTRGWTRAKVNRRRGERKQNKELFPPARSSPLSTDSSLEPLSRFFPFFFLFRCCHCVCANFVFLFSILSKQKARGESGLKSSTDATLSSLRHNNILNNGRPTKEV